MQAELDTLAEKVAQLAQLARRLRSENNSLRQDLAHELSQSRQYCATIDSAKARLEQLLAQLPEEEA